MAEIQIILYTVVGLPIYYFHALSPISEVFINIREFEDHIILISDL